jgi:membrane protein
LKVTTPLITVVSHLYQMKRLSVFFTQLWNTLRLTLKIFVSENYFRYGASLSYYTIFSLAPLLIITISLCGYFFGGQAMEGELFTEIRKLVGDNVAIQIQEMMQHVVSAQNSFVVNAVAVIAMVLGITSLFAEVQDATNHIWKLKAKPKRDWKKYILKRGVSFAIFCITGFLLVLALAINWLINFFGDYLGHLFARGSTYLVFAINQAFIIVIVTMLFTFILKYMPDGKVKWKDAVKGALFTSILFMLGNAGIGYTLVHSHIASMYGAAGSLVFLILWIYYSGIILYFGMAFTKVYAHEYGGKIIPRSYAVHSGQMETEPDKSNVA